MGDGLHLLGMLQKLATNGVAYLNWNVFSRSSGGRISGSGCQWVLGEDPAMSSQLLQAGLGVEQHHSNLCLPSHDAPYGNSVSVFKLPAFSSNASQRVQAHPTTAP